jgi:hypothetical protein
LRGIKGRVGLPILGEKLWRIGAEVRRDFKNYFELIKKLK